MTAVVFLLAPRLHLLDLAGPAQAFSTAICSGAFALARAGLLDGRRCTTHHTLQDALARRYPAATVLRDTLVVVDGRVVTSAGIASGIDLTLHLLAAWHGPAFAAVIAAAGAPAPTAPRRRAGPPRQCRRPSG